jgi:2,3-bisphosphoglycerate-independent phosphoglycerate mutase
MVGHTGVISAVMKAVQTVDTYLGDIIDIWLQYDYSFVIIADHGNADQMIAEDGKTPHTAHTTNLVPCIVISSESLLLQPGKLGDIAPTILDLMWIQQPEVMTGKSLIQSRN